MPFEPTAPEAADPQSEFSRALEALAAELAKQAPTAKRELDKPRVRGGGMPDIGPLPPRQEARSAQPPMPSVISSPLDYFRAVGAQRASMLPEDQMNELGRTARMGSELTFVPGLLRALVAWRPFVAVDAQDGVSSRAVSPRIGADDLAAPTLA
jgi:hypothetical protein